MMAREDELINERLRTETPGWLWKCTGWLKISRLINALISSLGKIDAGN